MYIHHKFLVLISLLHCIISMINTRKCIFFMVYNFILICVTGYSTATSINNMSADLILTILIFI